MRRDSSTMNASDCACPKSGLYPQIESNEVNFASSETIMQVEYDLTV
jgi:hypothetical protein